LRERNSEVADRIQFTDVPMKGQRFRAESRVRYYLVPGYSQSDVRCDVHSEEVNNGFGRTERNQALDLGGMVYQLRIDARLISTRNYVDAL
jgi:hypothetical protein